jgi:putative copper resistance protein D
VAWLTAWQFAPVVSAVLVVMAAGYTAAAAAVARRHPARPWPAARTAAFGLALAVIAVATQSSVGVHDEEFPVHMVQHLLLIMVAPPLLVVGRPVTLLLHAARNPLHTRVKRIVRSRFVSGMTWPGVAVPLYAAVVAGTHLTPLTGLMLENPALHEAEHALYLVAGYLYFLPVVGSEPIRWRLPVFGRYLLLLATMPVDTAVGVFLMLAPHGMFPAQAAGDLHRGGLVMFAGSDLIMAVIATVLAVAFVRAGERERPRADLDAYNAYLAALGEPKGGLA